MDEKGKKGNGIRGGGTQWKVQEYEMWGLVKRRQERKNETKNWKIDAIHLQKRNENWQQHLSFVLTIDLMANRIIVNQVSTQSGPPSQSHSTKSSLTLEADFRLRLASGVRPDDGEPTPSRDSRCEPPLNRPWSLATGGTDWLRETSAVSPILPGLPSVSRTLSLPVFAFLWGAETAM